MPKFVRARPPLDDGEARKIRQLAGARHAPADWIERARIVTLSWDGRQALAGQEFADPDEIAHARRRVNCDSADARQADVN